MIYAHRAESSHRIAGELLQGHSPRPANSARLTGGHQGDLFLRHLRRPKLRVAPKAETLGFTQLLPLLGAARTLELKFVHIASSTAGSPETSVVCLSRALFPRGARVGAEPTGNEVESCWKTLVELLSVQDLIPSAMTQ